MAFVVLRTAPSLALSGPNRPTDAATSVRRPSQPHSTQKTRRKAPREPQEHHVASSTPQPSSASEPPLPPTDDFSDWSGDFLRLCNEQLSLLMATIPAVDQVALFFRREHARTGALEFVPLMVHTAGAGADPHHDAPARVWISAGAAATTDPSFAPSQAAAAAGPDDDARRLPGSIPAAWLIPDYPFANVPPLGGFALPDASLCVPVLHDGTLAGAIILRPAAARARTGGGGGGGAQAGGGGGSGAWSADETSRAAMVAKTVALGAALEGRWHADQTIVRDSRRLIASVRSLLRNTLHQVRSPLQALVTFGHILMRRLPVHDEGRSVAKNIVVEALRVDELLNPLDRADDVLALPPPPGREAGGDGGHDHAFASDAGSGEADADFGPAERGYAGAMVTPPSRYSDGPVAQPPGHYSPYVQPDASHAQTGLPDGATTGDTASLQVVWLADVLEPLLESSRVLAAERGLALHFDVDEDMPPVWAVGPHVREAVSNLLDNAVKYVPDGSRIDVRAWLHDADNGDSVRLLQSVALPGDEDGEECAVADAELVVLVVADTGYGVPDCERDEVWRYGWRTSAAARSGEQGSGIGLSLVRDLVRQCGAAITLLSPLPDWLDARDATTRADGRGGAAFVIVFRRARR